MKIDANDPKWTAYALGELMDEKERAEIESILEKSPEMRRLVEEIRETAGLIKEELQSEQPITLTQAQRKRIEEKANAGRSWFGLRPAWAMACAAAAVMLISFVLVKQLKQSEPPSQQEKLVSVNPKTPPPNPIQDSGVALIPKSGKPLSPVIQRASSTSKNLAENEKPETMTPLPQVNSAPSPSADMPAASVAQIQPITQPGSQRSALSGTVTDSSQAVLPGATVTATNTQTGTVTTTLTNNAGIYNFPGLQAGAYKVTTEMKGFQTSMKSDVPLAASAQARLNFEMPISSVQEAVEVVATAPETLMESSISTGQALPPGQVTELPLMNNNVSDLIKIMGGAASNQFFAGVNSANLDLQKDGITVSDAQYPSGVVSPGSLDSKKVGEFKMALAPVDAELARGTGPVSGTAAGSGGGIGTGKGTGVGPWVAPPPQRPVPPPPPYYQGPWPPPWPRQFNTEAYDHIRDNAFLDVAQNPLSTFSIDVDTASYSNVRRFLDSGRFPPKDAVRIEELVNYFDYDYKAPKDGKPFAANFEITEAPWDPSHQLLRIALKGREIQPGKRPNSNLVFLLDVSGSMGDANKLPLVKQSMGMLVDRLTESDRVAIVVYSTDTSLHLPSTSGDQKERLRYAIDSLQAGGCTNGAAGIQLAYQTAQQNFLKGGVNRVILATDGDFNVGITNRGDLTRLIEEKAQSGIYLSALGFGMGNLKDATLELLANKGHGNYAYIDTLQEAQKVLVEQMNATLVTIAKDVKIQVEFNPRHVSAYRLIGYEDRIMAKEDFNNDAKQAGVIGAGHAVTALYELVPSGLTGSTPAVDPLKYQKQVQPTLSAHSDEVVTVKVRSKEPEKDTSVMSEFAVKESEAKFSNASPDFKFAASVAAFGMVLRDSPYKGTADLFRVLDWAMAGKGDDSHGYRQEFIRLVRRAISLSF
jgi:Ca-activated chloride channel family protein